MALLEASGQVVGQGFKGREVRAFTKTTYQQSKCVVRCGSLHGWWFSGGWWRLRWWQQKQKQ